MRHSSLGPSQAHRYRRCPGAPNAERGLPDTVGIEAAEGSCFHEYADICLTTGIDPVYFIGARYLDDQHGLILFNAEMAHHMRYGLDQIEAMASEPGAVLFVENEVDLAPWLGEGQIGTSDCGIINPVDRSIVIFDWKYGMVPVSPDENDQAILYALGFWNTFAKVQFEGVEPATIAVTVIIEQPRAPGGGGVWRTTMAAILREGEKIKVDAAATLDPNAPRIPGEKQCQWCKAARYSRCPENLAMKLSVFDLVEDNLDEDQPPSFPSLITPERRGYILRHAPLFRKFLEQLHAEAYQDALAGRPTPGQKLVPGRRSAREWRDPEKQRPILERRLGAQAYVSKLASPTQVEDAIGKKQFKKLFGAHVKEQEAKPILVDIETDKREPIKGSVDRMTAMLENEDLI